VVAAALAPGLALALVVPLRLQIKAKDEGEAALLLMETGLGRGHYSEYNRIDAVSLYQLQARRRTPGAGSVEKQSLWLRHVRDLHHNPLDPRQRQRSGNRNRNGHNHNGRNNNTMECRDWQ
jgi:hypothetical protein